MQAIWKGHISFGLVSVPVSVYSATVEQRISFNLLHAKDNSPIKYRKFCEEEDVEVPPDEIVRGYQFERNRYVIVTDKDLEKVDVKLTKTIDIVNFVKLDELDPMWLDRPYYLEVQKGGEKPYELLRRALDETGLVGVCKTVLRNREHLGFVAPHHNVLMLELMRFGSEVRSAEKLNDASDVKVEKKQLELAKELIHKMAEKFHFEECVDEYTTKMMEIIRKKAEGRKITVPRAAKVPEVKNLMEALRKSLKAA